MLELILMGQNKKEMKSMEFIQNYDNVKRVCFYYCKKRSCNREWISWRLLGTSTLFLSLRDYYLHSLYIYVNLYTLYCVPYCSQILFMIKCSFLRKMPCKKRIIKY